MSTTRMSIVRKDILTRNDRMSFGLFLIDEASTKIGIGTPDG
jgi:hypothetical protein